MARWYEFNSRDRVRVVSRDDCFCKRLYLNQVGEITKISYGAGEWTVGESRKDPYATVRFANGKKDGFFLTELMLVPKDTPLTTPVEMEEDGELYLY